MVLTLWANIEYTSVWRREKKERVEEEGDCHMIIIRVHRWIGTLDALYFSSIRAEHNSEDSASRVSCESVCVWHHTTTQSIW